MINSFVEKLYYIFNKSRCGGKGRFRAFCILLQSIHFIPNEDFINAIINNISKHRQQHKKLLIGRPIQTESLEKYNIKHSDIDYIFESLFYLNTKISSSLMHSLCDNIDDAELEKYLRGLFYSYFNLIKTGKITAFNLLSDSNKIKYLRNNIPSTKSYKLPCHGPQMTTNSGVWGLPPPFRIKSIPMGGRNKKY